MLPRFPKKATGRNCPCGPWRSFGRACDILVSLRDTTMFSDRRARGSKSRNLNHANAVTPSRTRSSGRGDRRAVLKSSEVSKAFLDRGSSNSAIVGATAASSQIAACARNYTLETKPYAVDAGVRQCIGSARPERFSPSLAGAEVLTTPTVQHLCSVPVTTRLCGALGLGQGTAPLLKPTGLRQKIVRFGAPK